MRGKSLTAKEFERIKKMQEFGLSNKLIADGTGRSPAIVSVIRKLDTFAAYKTHNASRIANSANHDKHLSERHENTSLILSRLENIEKGLNELLRIIEAKEAKANVNFWKR